MTAEPVIWAECGDEIDPPEAAVRMVKDDAASAVVSHRGRPVFHFHMNCAPEELVGAWVRVYD